jgi:hypothetical protein
MSDIPYGFEKPVAQRLKQLVASPGISQAGGDPLPEQRRVVIALAPSGGIPARVSTQLGSATCTICTISASGVVSTTSITETVWNLSAGAVASNAYIGACRELVGGKWIAFLESCDTP